jgi:peptide/nickel transport system substrate-binding protein
MTAGLVGKAASPFAQGTPKRGGTLVATWGGGEPQAAMSVVAARARPSPPPLFGVGQPASTASSSELAEAWKLTGFPSYTITSARAEFHDGKDMTVDDASIRSPRSGRNTPPPRL